MQGARDTCGLEEMDWQRVVAHAAALTRRGPKGDVRTFVAAVTWILRTGAPWRDLAERFGRWDRVYRRYRRWALAGRWDALGRKLTPRESTERMLLIDSTIVKAHAHAAGALRRNGGQAGEALGRSRGGFTTKLHALVTAGGRLVRFILTGGERHDITQAQALVRVREGTHVVGDRAYDSDAFHAHVKSLRMRAVIPSTRARRHPRRLDRTRYAERNIVERWFGRMKMFRRIATRYEKTSISCAGFVMVGATLVALTGWPR
jgi:transposase